MITREQAKAALDNVIKKSRVHWYKPIQVAEILYRDRVNKDINLLSLEDYRTKSKKWRDDVSIAFEDFTQKVMCLDSSAPQHIQEAKVYRGGVTNAADRGLDMYSNWGPAIQIKHLSLDVTLAESIVNSVSSDRVVIVCKDAEKDVILSLLTQIGWRSHIQSIVTENDLVNWYEKALRGSYSDQLGEKLLYSLASEIAEEFPSVNNTPEMIKKRHNERISDPFWTK